MLGLLNTLATNPLTTNLGFAIAILALLALVLAC